MRWLDNTVSDHRENENECLQTRKSKAFLSNLKSLNHLHFSENKRTNTNCLPLEDLLVFKLS